MGVQAIITYKLCGGTGGGGGMGMEAPGQKALVSHSRTNWGWGCDAGQSFYRPEGGA